MARARGVFLILGLLIAAPGCGRKDAADAQPKWVDPPTETLTPKRAAHSNEVK